MLEKSSPFSYILVRHMHVVDLIQRRLVAFRCVMTDVVCRFYEGGIQSAVSLGWSENVDERINSFSILANKAQQSVDFQSQIVEGGGVRLVCSLIMRPGKTEQE